MFWSVWLFPDVDDGTSLKKLVIALKDLTSNNFGQGVLTLGCVGIGANFDLIQSILGGCAMGVLYGHPMSGKTTVLKAVLLVVGQSGVIQRRWFLIYYKLEFNSVQKLWLGLAEQYQVKQ